MERMVEASAVGPARAGWARAAAAMGLMLLLAACARPFEARVQSFQAMPAATGQTFALAPQDEARAGSLEFQSYARLVAAELSQRGFRESGTGQADLTVRIDYGAGPGRERLATRPGFASPWGWYGRGWWGRPLWWGGFYDPFWGPGFGAPEVYSFTVYPAFLDVEIRRAADNVAVFESRAETTTRINDLPSTMPQLVEAMFQDFPGEGSRSRIVRVPSRR